MRTLLAAVVSIVGFSSVAFADDGGMCRSYGSAHGYGVCNGVDNDDHGWNDGRGYRPASPTKPDYQGQAGQSGWYGQGGHSRRGGGNMSPFDLVNMAYRGYLRDYGIRGYGAFCGEFLQPSRSDARVIIQAGAARGWVSMSLVDDGYVNAVRNHMRSSCD